MKVIVPMPSSPKLDTRPYAMLMLFVVCFTTNLASLLIPGALNTYLYKLNVSIMLIQSLQSFGVALGIVCFVIFWNESYWAKKLGFKSKEMKINEWGERID